MGGEKILAELREIAENPFACLRDLKSRSPQKVLGYFCNQVPEELIQAAGLVPARILGSRETISFALQHLQSYSCSLVQSSLEAALRGKLDFLEGILFPHTCDSIQRLSDIWAESIRLPFHWDLVLPVKLHTASARDYLLQELRRFQRGLEEFTGKPISPEDLRQRIYRNNENRGLLREFYRRREMNPEILPDAAMGVLVKTAMILPRDEHTRKMRELLALLAPSPCASRKVRLFLAGSVCDDFAVFDLLGSCGAALAGDDLCSGWRFFSADVSPEGDPIEALADRLLGRAPCPCKYHPDRDGAQDLLHRVEASQARGVVFLLLKFCDPHAFDYPYLKETLESRGIATLLLEMEPGGTPLQALETRLQAFVETLGG